MNATSLGASVQGQTNRFARISSSVLAAVSIGALAACSDGGAGPAPMVLPPTAVEIITVTPGEIVDVVDLVGQLDADESVQVKSEGTGILESVEFEEGQAVDKGALLFRLRNEEQVARLQEAEARLALADEEYGRSSTLKGKGTLSQAELDRATAERDGARARRDLARIELRRMEVRAPFAGVLGARVVSPGDRVNNDTGMVQIDAVDRLRLLFSLPEIAVPLARTGARLEIGVAPWPGELFAGEVYFVAPALDPANRRILLKAFVENRDHKLRPGMFATITVEVARKNDALVVPEAAIAYDTEGPYVWRVGVDDTAERARVALGIRRTGKVEITQGLEAGDRIVSAGSHKVAPGAKVKAVLPPAAAPATG